MKTLLRFKNITLCIFLFLLYSCITKEGSVPDGNGKNKKKETESVSVYIGEMYYLAETEEFYTPLFFNPDFDEADTNTLIAKSDSTVYETNRMTRKRIPMTEAQTAFMLDDLDTLFIYDMHHILISRAAFVRVESLATDGEDKFIAVYKADKLKTDPAERYYGINNLLSDRYISDFRYRVVNDPSLNKFIMHGLKRDPDVKWDITNIEVLPNRGTYSVVNSTSESFITELNNNNQFSVVINMNRGYRVGNISPLPYEFNQRPLMFIRYYKHNENSLQTSLAVFADYQEYKLLPHNRLKLK